MYKKTIYILVLLILSFFAIKPLFIAGFFPIHDNAQVQRVFEMKNALSDGMFPVRWVEDLGYGYGYPIFNFYAPLAYYIGGLFNLLGFDPLSATKIMLGLGIILSGLTMYLFSKEFWGKSGGLISGLLYLFAPYHALNIYVRGDFAEVWAYVFIPLVFLGIYKIHCHCETSKWRSDPTKWIVPLWGNLLMTKEVLSWIILSSLSFAGIITSHNLTAMMITPFIIAYALILILTSAKKNHSSFMIHNTFYIILFLTLALSISAFYWLPALTEMKYTNVLSQIGGGADFRDHFVCPTQLWESPWGFGGSAPGCSSDGLSFRIGKIHILLAALSFLVLFFVRKSKKNLKTQIIFFLLSLLASIYFMLSISKPIWETIPQMEFFQYPWRFLLLSSFSISFLGGAFTILLKNSKVASTSFLILTILAIVVINAKLFNPQYIMNIRSSDFINNINLKWTTSKISDEYLPKNFSKPKTKNEVPNNKLTATNNKTTITMQENRTQQFSAIISSPVTTKLFINLAWFPAWHIYINNSEAKFIQRDNGLELTIPKGEHIATAKFIQTPIETIANILTLIGSFAIVVFIGIITYTNVKKTT